MLRPLFVLRTYNDIDHIAPLIWKCILNKCNPVIIFNSSYNYSDDERINLLIKAGNVEIVSMPDLIHEKRIIYLGSKKKVSFFTWVKNKFYNQIRKPHLLIGKIYRKIYFDSSEIYQFFKDRKINVVIFEWGNPDMKGEIFEKILKVSKGLGITTLSLPHGLNIYLNSDMHSVYINKIKKGILPDFDPWNTYDKIIVQSVFHANHMIRFGIRSDKVEVWGSTRFSPEWQEVNKHLYDSFVSEKNSENKVKIVFMMPHWIYNVDKEKTIELIRELSQNLSIHLVIKDHTRGDTGTFPTKEKYLLSKNNNIEFNSSVSSTALINWSDIIINFGSSIGLEAIYQGKIIIYPCYLHKNETIHDTLDTTYKALSSKDVLQLIDDFKNKNLISKPQKDIEKLFNTVVYGGKDPFNVLDHYYQQLIISSNKI